MLTWVYITKFPRKRLVFVVFRVYSYDIRLKLVRKHSPAVFIQIQDGVREGPFSSDFGDFEREEKFFRKLRFGLSCFHEIFPD